MPGPLPPAPPSSAATGLLLPLLGKRTHCPTRFVRCEHKSSFFAAKFLERLFTTALVLGSRRLGASSSFLLPLDLGLSLGALPGCRAIQLAVIDAL